MEYNGKRYDKNGYYKDEQKICKNCKWYIEKEYKSQFSFTPIFKGMACFYYPGGEQVEPEYFCSKFEAKNEIPKYLEDESKQKEEKQEKQEFNYENWRILLGCFDVHKANIGSDREIIYYCDTEEFKSIKKFIKKSRFTAANDDLESITDLILNGVKILISDSKKGFKYIEKSEDKQGFEKNSENIKKPKFHYSLFGEKLFEYRQKYTGNDKLNYYCSGEEYECYKNAASDLRGTEVDDFCIWGVNIIKSEDKQGFEKYRVDNIKK